MNTSNTSTTGTHKSFGQKIKDALHIGHHETTAATGTTTMAPIGSTVVTSTNVAPLKTATATTTVTAAGAPKVFQEAPIIREFQDQTVVGEIHERSQLEIQDRKIIKEFHEKPIVELHQHPIVQTVNEPTSFINVREQTLVEQVGAPQKVMLPNAPATRVVQEAAQVRTVNQGAVLTEIHQQPVVEIHHQPVITEIHNKPVVEVHEQEIIRKVYEQPEFRVVQDSAPMMTTTNIAAQPVYAAGVAPMVSTTTVTSSTTTGAAPRRSLKEKIKGAFRKSPASP